MGGRGEGGGGGVRSQVEWGGRVARQVFGTTDGRGKGGADSTSGAAGSLAQTIPAYPLVLLSQARIQPFIHHTYLVAMENVPGLHMQQSPIY